MRFSYGRSIDSSKWYAELASVQEFGKVDISNLGIAVASLALQLAGGLIKLYDFWGTVRDAPHEVSEMLKELKLLSSILDTLVSRKDPSPHVKDALEHCDTKVEVREPSPNLEQKEL